MIQKPGLVGMYRPHWRAPNVEGLWFASETFRSRGIGVDRAARAGLTVVEDYLGKRLPGLRGDLALLMGRVRWRDAWRSSRARAAASARRSPRGSPPTARRVVVNDVDEDVARAAAEEIPGRPCAVGSVADSAVTDELVTIAEREFGTLDLVVNNAGITRDDGSTG